MSDVEPHRYVSPEERLPGYLHIPHLGDPSLYNLMKGEVVIQEKLDGSLFRWQNQGDRLQAGSKNVIFTDTDPPKGYFLPAVRYLESILDRIPQGFVFYGELVASSKHNAITYSKVPTHQIMLFDAINVGLTEPVWMRDHEWIREQAERMEIDPPTVFYRGQGSVANVAMIEELLKRTSYLGGSIIEGVVIKNYSQPSADRYHPLGFCCGKMVRESFREENRSMWKAQTDVVAQIAMRFKTSARFEKAVVHARDQGLLEDTMRDMHVLLEMIDRDIEEEIKPAALEMLWKRFEFEIRKTMKVGLAEFYKQKLLERQFAQDTQVEIPVDSSGDQT